MVKVILIIGDSPLSTFQEIYDFFAPFGMIEKLKRKKNFSILKFRKQYSYQRISANIQNLSYQEKFVKIQIADINHFDAFNFSNSQQDVDVDQDEEFFKKLKKRVINKNDNSKYSSQNQQRSVRSINSEELSQREFREFDRQHKIKSKSQFFEKKQSIDDESLISDAEASHKEKEKKKLLKNIKRLSENQRKENLHLMKQILKASKEVDQDRKKTQKKDIHFIWTDSLSL